MTEAVRVTRSLNEETLVKYFRTPKGLLILALGALVLIAGYGSGPALVGPKVVASVAVAMLVDGFILRARKGRWTFPDGALLTGLIVAMVLAPFVSWQIAAITSIVAILSKYVLRAGTANMFNPAALGLVITFHLMNTGQSWWGALPELAPIAIVALFAAGIFITLRVNKAPVVLAFLGAYYLLITIAAFVGDPAHVAELYRTPDLHAALYFAFFMVNDPPTSPPKQNDQLIFGVIVAVFAFALFELVGSADYLLIGLLIANGWEAWRRTGVRIKKSQERAARGPVRQ